jgi:hypothetical protein
MTNGASSETSADPKKTKTETIAFRLSSALIDELRRDAELEKVLKFSLTIYNGNDMKER